jgi:hypothetical protein
VSKKFWLKVISFLEFERLMVGSRLMVYFDCDKLLLRLGLDLGFDFR